MKVAAELEMSLDNILSQYNLSSGRYTLLYVLKGAPNGLMPSELAQSVGVTQATISGLLNSLEKAGLITREVHPRDARSFMVKLTQKGDETLKEIFPKWYPLIQSFWSQFSEHETKEMNQYLHKLLGWSSVLRGPNS